MLGLLSRQSDNTQISIYKDTKVVENLCEISFIHFNFKAKLIERQNIPRAWTFITLTFMAGLIRC